MSNPPAQARHGKKLSSAAGPGFPQSTFLPHSTKKQDVAVKHDSDSPIIPQFPSIPQFPDASQASVTAVSFFPTD